MGGDRNDVNGFRDRLYESNLVTYMDFVMSVKEMILHYWIISQIFWVIDVNIQSYWK